MSNPLFNMLGGSRNGNMAEMIQQFNQFKKTFSGDPRQQIQNLLNSGKVTQEQYNRAVQMANQMMEMMK